MDGYPREMSGDRTTSSRLHGDVSSSGAVNRRGMRLQSVAYEQIKEQLLEGRWPAGERLALETFKSQLGVSKQPVMDALRRLASDGLVEIIPQVGCRVASYDPQEVSDFFTLFAAFEGAIAGVAAGRRTDADLAHLHGMHTRIGALCGEQDVDGRAHGYRVLNREFHGLIHRMARSNIVEEMSLRMWDLSDFLINTAGVPHPLSSALDARHADHEAIYQALVVADTAAARTEMERHVLGTLNVIGEELQSASGL
jgi:DNA-binding GntR family transcriptional regulator